MRTLLLMRGCPGCGKTTYIEQNGLKSYTLSADDIRLLCSSPVLQADGTTAISQANNGTVWDILFKMLEVRMKRGEFTVIDATNSKISEMNRYKKLSEEYRYRIYCIDFTEIPIEECKKRNKSRAQLKRVPEEVIDKMYSRFSTQQIPSGITVIQPNELEKIWYKKNDLSEYSKIHFIGDIHGCYSVLKEYMDSNGGIKQDEFYIFTGDYIDRGLENADLLNYLFTLNSCNNVTFIEGNHDKWLWIWANHKNTQSKEFEFNTKKELEKHNIDKKQARMFYRKMNQCSYFEYNGKIFLATHGGLSTLPEHITTVSTETMIKGSGNYSDFEIMSESFYKNTDNNIYQIYGHRNTKQLPIKINERVFNLEGRVEFGGHLRCIQVSKTEIKCIETKNNIFKNIICENSITQKPMADLIMDMRNNKYIQEKTFGNISSFNFNRKAFFEKQWDNQTIKARGLYINTANGKIIARAYDKFFNINERLETNLNMLQDKMKFPVTAYVKENGFLGIVGYNEESDDLFITTKSDPNGEYANWFKSILYTKLSETKISTIKEYIKNNNVSLVFECIDTLNDPHVIAYHESNIILLDVIYNEINFKKYTYEKTVEVANTFGFSHKIKAFQMNNWQDFYDWYYRVLDEKYLFDGKNIEGFVIEDASGYMTKLKLTYYNFWKFMRSISFETIKYGYTNRTSSLVIPLANEYYGWLKKQCNTKDKRILPKNICGLRKMFYEQSIE